jgi:O-antigen ligase
MMRNLTTWPTLTTSVTFYRYFTLLVSLSLAFLMIRTPQVAMAVLAGVPVLWLWYRYCFQDAGLNLREKLFFVFVAGTFAFSKNFSVLHVTLAGLPLFVSEAVLFFLLATLVFPRLIRGIARSPGHPVFYLLLLYFLVGAWNLFRGLPENGVFALRDAAVVYYAAFYLVTVEIFDHRDKFLLLFRVLLVSAVVLLILGMLFCTPFYAKIPYQYSKAINLNFLYGLVLIFLLAFYTMMGKRKKWSPLLFLPVFFLVVFMQARTIWVSLTVAFVFMLFMMRREIDRIIFRNILVFLLFFPLLLGLGYAVNKDRILTLGKEAVSIFRPDMNYHSASHVRWRFMLWEQATRRGIREHPLLGSGFGADYRFMINGRYVAKVQGVGANSGIVPPHNGYIALFFKMGLLGLLLFALVNITFFVSCFHFYQRCREGFEKKCILAIMASQIHICTGAFFFEAIEVPQVGIFLWVLMGLGVAMMQIDRERKEER